jgi:hypothetical protein
MGQVIDSVNRNTLQDLHSDPIPSSPEIGQWVEDSEKWADQFDSVDLAARFFAELYEENEESDGDADSYLARLTLLEVLAFEAGVEISHE